MILTLVLASLLVAKPAEGVQRFAVVPSDTDQAIQAFNSPHLVFLDPEAKSRNQLLVFLPGTNGTPGRTDAFCETAAGAGYMVINLMYPDAISAASVSRSADPNELLNFRLEVIEGRDLSKYIEVDRTNSIENRLIKLLQFLDKRRPSEHWGRFLTSTGEPKWSSIAVSGLSQGAGHAALIAVRHRVARAVLFGGPKDFDKATNKPAAWYKPPATPLSLIFTFNHEQDRQGCNFEQQLENCRALGLDKFGDVVSVDKSNPPYRNSHILSTNYPGTPVPSIQAHTSVVADGASPLSKDGTRLFKPVWIYMLTAG
jgi:dienelactone hydrolase